MTPDRKRQQQQKHGIPVVAAAYVDKAIRKTLQHKLNQLPPMGTVNSDPRTGPFLFGSIVSRDHLVATESRDFRIGGDQCNWMFIPNSPVYVHGYEYICFQRRNTAYRYVALRVDRTVPMGVAIDTIGYDKLFFVSDKQKLNFSYFWSDLQELLDAVAQNRVFIC